MSDQLTSNQRDFLTELELANERPREIMLAAGREINYLRSVIADMLPYFPRSDRRHIGFSEAASTTDPPLSVTRLSDFACDEIVSALESYEWTGFSRDDIRLIAGTIETYRASVPPVEALLSPSECKHESAIFKCRGCGLDIKDARFAAAAGREPPHCSTCSCGMEPDEDAVRFRHLQKMIDDNAIISVYEHNTKVFALAHFVDRHRRLSPTKSERCPCGAELPPLSEWSMPHCPKCVAAADTTEDQP